MVVAFLPPSSCQHRSIAAGGTRQGLMLRWSGLRPDCAAVRAPGSCRITRYAPIPSGSALRSNRCGKSVGEARGYARRPRSCAPRHRRNRPRRAPPAARSRPWLVTPNTASVAAKPVQGRSRFPCRAPRHCCMLCRRIRKAKHPMRMLHRCERTQIREWPARQPALGGHWSQADARAAVPYRSITTGVPRCISCAASPRT